MKQLKNNSKQAKLQGIKEWDEKMSDGEGNAQRCTSPALSEDKELAELMGLILCNWVKPVTTW